MLTNSTVPHGPDFVALQVRDVDAAASFFTDVVGLDPAPQSPPGAVVFATTPISFAVRPPLVDLDAVDRLGWGVSLWLAVPDVDALHDRLAAAGAEVLAPPSDGPFGRQLTFVGPEGYALVAHAAA